MDMSSDSIDTVSPVRSSTYYKFSKYYDRFFGRVYETRIQDTIRRLGIPPGANVLELGVGTGISLAAYPPHAKVVGVDLSESMLSIAKERVVTNQWQHVELMCMNAAELDFPDGSFDYVMAFHLVSVVDDVAKLTREMHRVTKSGGRLVIINHFRSPRWWIAPMMDCISPLTKHLGWRTTLRREEIFQSAPIVVEKTYKTSPLSLFTIVVGRTNSQN